MKNCSLCISYECAFCASVNGLLILISILYLGHLRLHGLDTVIKMEHVMFLVNIRIYLAVVVMLLVFNAVIIRFRLCLAMDCFY